MGTIYPGIHKPVVCEILKYFQVDVFIETGTYLGDTAYWASKYFKQVISIEKSKPLWEKAVETYSGNDNLEFLFGDSATVLGEILPKITQSKLFWLDAHWSGGLTYGKDHECALEGELEIILKMAQNSFILIDDARLFLMPPPHPYDPFVWPDLEKLSQILDQSSNLYTVVMDDVIIIAPKYAKQKLIEYFQDCATNLWNDSNSRPGLLINSKCFFRNIIKRIHGK